MLIEYKIKFEEDGVTITQRVEPDSSGSAPVERTIPPSGLTGRSLGRAFEAPPGRSGQDGKDQSGTGGGPGDPTGPGGQGPGTRPTIILGPIVVGAPARKPDTKAQAKESQPSTKAQAKESQPSASAQAKESQASTSEKTYRKEKE